MKSPSKPKKIRKKVWTQRAPDDVVRAARDRARKDPDFLAKKLNKLTKLVVHALDKYSKEVAHDGR